MSDRPAAASRSVTVQIRRMPGGEDLPLPRPATEHAAGVDLRAAVEQPLTLGPGRRARVPTGIALALPAGFEAQVRPRSGLAWRAGLTLLNSPGTIDADYRGEVQLIVVNLGDEPVTVARGDRLAQLIVQPVPRVEWREVDRLDETERGGGGFGHTGER